MLGSSAPQPSSRGVGAPLYSAERSNPVAQVPLERVVIQAVAVLVGIGASLLAPALALDAPALLVALLLCCLFDLTGHRARTALVLASFGLLALWKPFSAFGPLVACLACASQKQPLRWLWIAPALLNARFFELACASGLEIFSAALFVLARRSERALAEKRTLEAARDRLQERVMVLDEEKSVREAHTGQAASAAQEAMEGLTEREQSILSLVAEGLDNKEVAGRLYLSEGTVRNHVSAILRKKQLHNRTQLVALYFRGPNGSVGSS
jgi:DNA-binding CsgD family transcriptional regulator